MFIYILKNQEDQQQLAHKLRSESLPLLELSPTKHPMLAMLSMLALLELAMALELAMMHGRAAM